MSRPSVITVDTMTKRFGPVTAVDSISFTVAEGSTTALLPLWHVAGFALGAGSALMGKGAAMACTVAVEEVINDHYAGQVAEIEDDGLKQTFEAFRLEELEHRETALAHGAELAPGYEGLTAVIKTCSRLAIWLSERI